ncbi:transposase [Streptomyces spectabilis]|uniref:Transposase n=1 Tax=Streptomyces spectabilis TaxID=68270 RepID=A0A7W8B3C6_STRST|nr:transposase [Streptomyces spectabilis]
MRDSLNTPLTAGMPRDIAGRDWLTVFHLPPYAPDLNPVEGVWPVRRRTTMANRAFADPDGLITAVRRGLRQLQYRHDVLNSCLIGTGLLQKPP